MFATACDRFETSGSRLPAGFFLSAVMTWVVQSSAAPTSLINLVNGTLSAAYTALSVKLSSADLLPYICCRSGSTRSFSPEGDAAAWRPGLALDQESFRKKSNRSEADWGDIRAAIEALNADNGGDAAGWRSTLEASLNVDGFVHWLAMNTVLQDWDTYGNLAHNYYLYTDPVDGRIQWIPWDHDLALQSAFGLRPPLSLDLADVGEEWPLIRRIVDDPVYSAQYWTYVEEFDATQFAASAMAERIRREHDLVAPYVREELPMYTSSTPAVFEVSVEQLMSHVEARHTVVTEALASR